VGVNELETYKGDRKWRRKGEWKNGGGKNERVQVKGLIIKLRVNFE